MNLDEYRKAVRSVPCPECDAPSTEDCRLIPDDGWVSANRTVDYVHDQRSLAWHNEHDGVCEAFEWIGQTWAHCDRCGKPYWVHSHDLQSSSDRSIKVPITPENAARCKHRWG